MLQNIPLYDICSLSDINQDDILISSFAPYLDTHKNLFATHRHTFYHLVLFTAGAGTHTIDFESFVVKPGQIYFMIPGQVHSWGFEGVTDGYIINFSTSFIQSFLLQHGYLDNFSFFSGNLADAVINLPAETYAAIKPLFENILTEVTNPGTSAADMIRLLMLQIFIRVNRVTAISAVNNNSSYNQTLLKNFKNLIEHHYTDIRLPKDYAAMLYITPNHLNAVCKDMMGIPAGEMIRNRVMLEAKRMLTNPQLSISEISLKLNFSDNSYFTKFFKKLEDTTPEEFRKKLLYDHGKQQL
ncbi:transcriptional regulator, AraC family [Mucilaginibacter lappiensis]|uniref:AraC-like DNA-binding protein n=1 Tax=Mucilaginibacter lappiensis TaxID=354630 RepID=A0ABR6PGE4_9SPHI|nr:helix-turn-helix transcriptional regulator [Mucilaginibacter lappiensis]MBB6108822.1 AraC-like DNA-binding protein [Mucilaginibacter lappiensis]SIQ63622.1 transcriptional regulator, AraC family [Mucilaginibacter lappiensis]